MVGGVAETSEAIFSLFYYGWEIVLILVVVLILFGSKHLPGRSDGLRKGFDEFRKAAKEVSNELQEAVNPHFSPSESRHLARMSFVLWLAQGFGIGRIPFAPGTFGSLAGLIWFALLLRTENFWFYVGGSLCGLALSVWLCGAAERILKQTDPGSVVLDEIAALPLCFLPRIATEWFRFNQMPPLENFFGPRAWVQTAVLFVLFRVFDILKPWPVRQSQRLPGGWGVTTDDVLAATYVAVVSLPFVF
jgi:phosphatidylglycerophosphatase A